ncbi:hypothetical protein DPMN_105787 [Dreissena polymorpha]|uniref:Uncharacterized protein n=1 Tax=Dreissena polymorpha TaxID=45954 RepID=A0A9D4K3W9_DREPO|nr:hypothetical protein DPMN_105787 [Dreissena polymorpha]
MFGEDLAELVILRLKLLRQGGNNKYEYEDSMHQFMTSCRLSFRNGECCLLLPDMPLNADVLLRHHGTGNTDCDFVPTRSL